MGGVGEPRLRAVPLGRGETKVQVTIRHLHLRILRKVERRTQASQRLGHLGPEVERGVGCGRHRGVCEAQVLGRRATAELQRLADDHVSRPPAGDGHHVGQHPLGGGANEQMVGHPGEAGLAGQRREPDAGRSAEDLDVLRVGDQPIEPGLEVGETRRFGLRAEGARRAEGDRVPRLGQRLGDGHERVQAAGGG